MQRPSHPAHAAGPPLKVAGALAGLAAVVVAVVVAVPTLGGEPAPAAGTIVTARSLTVTVAQHVVPLTADELATLQGQPPDLGALGQPARLSSCLAGLGYPSATEVLGARPVEVNGRSAVVLLLAADDPALVSALAVTPQCSVAFTGLLADTTVPRVPPP